MAEKEDDLVKSVESLLAEKQAVAAREKKLIEDLNTVLGKMGYRVVSTKSGVHTGAGAEKNRGGHRARARGNRKRRRLCPDRQVQEFDRFTASGRLVFAANHGGAAGAASAVL